MSRVLVTGGAGFIGSHVVDRLRAAGHRPVIFDVRPSPFHDDVETIVGDVRDPEAVRAAMRRVDAVAHLAAAADVGEVAKDPIASEQLNCRGTVNVLEAARSECVDRVLYASTIWVYSDVKEDSADEETLLPAPAHLYTATKLAGELYCRSYGELYGVNTTILRFGIPYGPRAREAAVVPTFVRKAMAGEPLTVAGGGTQARRFVYVEDLAEGVVRALAPGAENRTFNLVGEQDVTIREVAATVGEVVGNTEIVEVDGRNGDFRGAEVSGRRAAEELGWRPETSFGDGVRQYVAWIREQDAAPAPAPARATEPRAALALQPAAVLTRARAILTARRFALATVGAIAGALTAAFTRTDAFEDPPKLLSMLLLTLIPIALVAGINWNRDRRDASVVCAALVVGALFALTWDWSLDVVHLTSRHPNLSLVLVLLAGYGLFARRRRRRTAGA